jgi:beta-lactamase regulating signal transducer with metallopeptidase domain
MIPAAASILLEAALRALFAACVLWAGLRLLRVRNVRAQKAAWSVMLIAGLAMPLPMLSHWFPAWAEVWLPAPSWFRVLPQAQAPVNAVQTVASPVQEHASAPQPNPVAADSDSAPDARVSEFDALPHAAAEISPLPSAASREAAPQQASRAPLDVLTVAWLVYLAVAAALLLRWLIGLSSSIRLWLQAKPVEAATECGMQPALATRSSNRISSPVNIGSGIILPADYSEWGTEKLRAVLAHERSHIRQRDFYLQLLAGLYTAFTWFSPLGWWLKHKLSELSEAISDRAGLEESASRSAYAQLLLEFAALPRPTLTGVAMAHSSNLSHRIERLLNESSFKQAFSGSRRALVAALIVPAVLVAAAALVRVQAAPLPQPAAAQSPAPQQPADQSPAAPDAQSPYTGQSNATQVANQSSDQAPAAPQPASVPAPASSAAPASEAAPAQPPAPPTMAFPAQGELPAIPPIPPVHVEVHVPPIPAMARNYAYAYDYDYEGPGSGHERDAYAIVGDPGNKPRFSGAWDVDRSAEIEKARKIAHGHFLLFRHDGKSYVVDDPATVSQIEAMDKALQDQGTQMRALGEQMRDAGRQAREAGRKAREAARTIPTPDLSKEMADLNAAVASLQAHQGATITHEQLAEIQRAISELQRRLIGAQVKVDLDLNGVMGQFGQEQGKFGEEMGKLGAQMGQTAHENHEKLRSIIDESLKNGKARPVE